MLFAVWSCEEESAVFTGNGKRASGGIRESNDWRVRGISITLTHTSSVAVVLSPDEFLSGRFAGGGGVSTSCSVFHCRNGL